MKSLPLIALTLAAGLVSAAAQSPVDSVATTPTYEEPPTLRTADYWEGNLLKGPHHRVRDRFETAGFTNTYIIDSDFGPFFAHGDHMLLERVREIYAIAALRKTKETDAYAKAVGTTAVSSLKGAGNLVTSPGDTISGVGRGAGRFFRSLGERLRNTGSDSSKRLKEYTGAKRLIAGEYKVDPYTSNQVYQDEVDSVADAASAGTLTFKLASLAIPGGGGIALRSLSISQDLNDILVSQGPFDLRVQNKNRLRKMELRDRHIMAFLDHPHLTPRHHTAITICLERLDGTRYRGDYVRLALAARSEKDAFFFSRNAGVLMDYHLNRSKIAAILDCKKIPAAYTAEGRLVMPIFLDYGSWTENTERLVSSFLAYENKKYPIKERELVISGVLTPRAKKEIELRGIILTERAFETLQR